MNAPIFRPLQLVLLGSLALVLLAIFVSGWLTWRERALLEEAREDFEQAIAFGEAHRALELELLAIVADDARPGREALLERVDELIGLCPESHPETCRLLTDFRGYVLGIEILGEQPMVQALRLFHRVAVAEARYEAQLVVSLEQGVGEQLRYELAAPAMLLAIAIVVIPLTRRRVVKPLEEFGRQIEGLSNGDFTPTPEERVDELTLPLHRNFLKLAVRLQELEREHREREATLRDEVRTATEALLAQQRSLAQAERLAVAGELAANMAHEVRNPLAGIQLSLSNLARELEDPELVERVELVVAEVERLTRLVNEIVDASRHRPETATRIALADLVDALLSLTRYQLPAGIELVSRVEEALHAKLPKERLRQVLLNLVLNAANAIDELDGRPGGRIELSIEQAEKGLRIEVADDGPGFPEEMLDTGIRPFFSTRRGGTGLGLAMVRRFVRDAEGRLELANRDLTTERKGARVTLLLPSVVDHG